MQSAFIFLVNTLFSLYLFVLTIRLILAFVGSNYFDPVTQFTLKLTDFLIKPLRRLIPNVRRVELSTLTCILVLEIIKFLFFALFSTGFPNLAGIVILAIGDSLNLLLEAFFYAILLQVIISWVQPMSPILQTLNLFTSPIMRPLHKIVPTVGGFDITPIPAIIGIQFLMLLIVNPIMATGMSVAFG
ncbi:MAG: hypothetical protein A3E85_05420 [Gammaproteobacteria bacterium RIFCSPHIGHO2_12_FULL_45_12]|nr:MAG: hypothetical protein A3E85_05420 [Gammaproteobacteria bacterium RIFCSPHIGHO2_12_FULL_45_12]